METKESLDDLVLEWRTAPKLTQRQRAELEHKIYMLLERPSRKEAKTDAATLVSTPGAACSSPVKRHWISGSHSMLGR